MTPAALFPDMRPVAPLRPRRSRRPLTLDACLDGPVASLSHEGFRAWAYLRLLPRATSVRRARALLEAHGLGRAVPELEAAGFVVCQGPPVCRPKRFPAVVPVLVDRAALVTAYRPLVDVEARRLAKRLPAFVALDDLVSEGYVALLKAARRYDPSTGVPFGAYARRRLRGALLDALRSLDPLSRRDRAEVSAGTKAWEEVSLDVAHDVPVAAAADQRAVDMAARRIDMALTALSPEDQEIVRQVWLEQEPLTAVAAAHQCSVSDLRRRLDAAMATLRAHTGDTASEGA